MKAPNTRRRQHRPAKWPRYLLAAAVLALAFVPFWNRGPVWLNDRETYTYAMILQGNGALQRIDEAGIALVHRRITEEARPILNPIAILQHHLRYRLNPERYDLIVGVSEQLPADSLDAVRREFAIYQSGHYVFLRIEPVGFNRVLHVDFSASDLENDLAPYIQAGSPDTQPSTGAQTAG